MAEWHPIRVVARRTGLSPHVIRAWEKRYQAVEPTRTPTNRRVYSTEDVERLLLLRRATLAGRSIGQIARLPTDALRKLLEEDQAALSEARSVLPVVTLSTDVGSNLLQASLEAVAHLDGAKLQQELDRASVALSRPALMEQVIVPLMHKLGEGWQEGTVRVSQEHLASAVIRSFVGNFNGAFHTLTTAPDIVITTPAGQLHEIGALLAAATAAMEGWRTTYLGPSLPADEIAAAARLKGAAAIGLSIVYPSDDPHVANDLKRLGQLLPDTPLILGGRAAARYKEMLQGVKVVHLTDLREFRAQLQAVRS